jgi:Putative quorum-sensing-regulated virulence factor
MTAMPFGKYRGWRIADLPLDYVEWCLDSISLREPLRSALRARVAEQPQPELRFPLLLDGTDTQLLLELVRAGRRSVAKICHPDAGGDVHTMQRVNRIVELVQQHAQGGARA